MAPNSKIDSESLIYFLKSQNISYGELKKLTASNIIIRDASKYIFGETSPNSCYSIVVAIRRNMGDMSKALEMCGSNECSKVDRPSKMFEYLRSKGLTWEKVNSIEFWKRSFGDLCENFNIKKSKRNCFKIKKMFMRKFSTEHQPHNIKDSSDSISVRFGGDEISGEINAHTIPETCHSPLTDENTIDNVTGINISSGTHKSDDKSIEIVTDRNFSSSTRISEGKSMDILTGINTSSGSRKSDDKSIDIATGRYVSSSFEEVPEVVLNINKKIDASELRPKNSINRKNFNLYRLSYTSCKVHLGNFHISPEEFVAMQKGGKLVEERWTYIISTKFKNLNNICILNIKQKRYISSKNC